MTITHDTLASIGACREAKQAFDAAFPDGAPDWAAFAAHPECEPTWIGWIAARAPDLTLEEREEFRLKSDDPTYWAGVIADSAPDLPAEGGDDD